MITLDCKKCKRTVQPEDCTHGGIHKTNDCFGIVVTYDPTGEEKIYYGDLNLTKSAVDG